MRAELVRNSAGEAKLPEAAHALAAAPRSGRPGFDLGALAPAGLFRLGPNPVAVRLGWFVLETTATSVFVTWIYLNANGRRLPLVAGTIPHLIFNLMPAAHVFPGGGEIQNRVQAIVMSLVALTVLGLYGPGSRVRGRRDAVPEPRGGW